MAILGGSKLARSEKLRFWFGAAAAPEGCFSARIDAKCDPRFSALAGGRLCHPKPNRARALTLFFSRDGFTLTWREAVECAASRSAMAYTVKQLASLAGVSVRTLHHYDEVGLLVPPVIGANGYRYYDERSVLRLQRILFYRELDFSLAAIKAALDRPDIDPLAALQEQRTALATKLGRLHRLIATIDHTIGHLKGEQTMSTKQLFAGLTPEQENANADEAARRWDEKTVRASQKKWNACTPAQKAQIRDEGNALYHALAAAMPQGPAAPEVQACIARWRKHLDHFWTPTLDQLPRLAAVYCDDPAFRRTYDAIHPELAPFMRDAVEVYTNVQRRLGAAAPSSQPKA